MKTESIQTIPPLCERVRELCEILRETRLQLAMIRRTEERFGATAFVRATHAELTSREANCLYLLRAARLELVNELEAA